MALTVGRASMSTETKDLLVLEDVEDPGKTDKLAARDLTAAHTEAEWIRTFVAQPNKDLGRDGPVCPFIGQGLENKTVWLALEQVPPPQGVPETRAHLTPRITHGRNPPSSRAVSERTRKATTSVQSQRDTSRVHTMASPWRLMSAAKFLRAIAAMERLIGAPWVASERPCRASRSSPKPWPPPSNGVARCPGTERLPLS
jgi:hypothetical protein